MKRKRVVDPSTDVAFVELPGGTIEIGLRKTERAVIDALVGDDGPDIPWPTARKVKVKPFRVSLVPLASEVVAPHASEWESFGSDAAHVSAADAAKVVAALGYRLLTDAEWEYVARSGGATAWAGNPGKRAKGYKRNAFGISDLGYGTWLAPARGKKPTLAAAGGQRSQPWQSTAEAVMVHAAYRERAKLAPLLVAWDGAALAKRATQAARAAKATPPATAWNGDTHIATGLRFVDVPGGTFEMGLSAAERARIETLLPAEHHALFAEIASHCPVRTVTVAPFRCSTAPVSAELSQKLGVPCNIVAGGAGVPLPKIQAWAKKFGFRLITEAEWEYALRDGGTRGWGDDLVALLERIPDPEREAPAYKNRFGIDGFYVGSAVTDGTLSRAAAWRDSGYPLEANEYIERMWRNQPDDWMPVLFALP